jgi:hypothetical protein
VVYSVANERLLLTGNFLYARACFSYAYDCSLNKAPRKPAETGCIGGPFALCLALRQSLSSKTIRQLLLRQTARVAAPIWDATLSGETIHEF